MGMKELKAAAVKNDIDEFMSQWDETMSSAAGIWMKPQKRVKLMKAVAAGKTFKTGGGADWTDEKAKAFKKKMAEKGWKVFDEEENYSSYDVIFVKEAVEQPKLRELFQEALKTPKAKAPKAKPVFEAAKLPDMVLFASDDHDSYDLVSEIMAKFGFSDRGSLADILKDPDNFREACEKLELDEEEMDNVGVYSGKKPTEEQVMANLAREKVIIWMR